jgi:hypothetical protein
MLSVSMALSLFSPKASSETISCCIRRGGMAIIFHFRDR